ncbi:MAG: hypothetical protein MSA53_07065 [Bacteroidales bacterium]|nr:hypothetical protein [Bacteroidales bacterium]
MRKSNLIFILASAALAAISCEGLQGDDADLIEPSQEDADPVEPFVLSVDKATIEANGDDLATFTIKDANGTLLTSLSPKMVMESKTKTSLSILRQSSLQGLPMTLTPLRSMFRTWLQIQNMW